MLQAIDVADLFFKILNGMLFLRVILSWLPHDPQQPLIRLLYEGTEPLLAPFRRIMPVQLYRLTFLLCWHFLS